MNQFSYHSEQVHSYFSNGKGQTRRNTVDIKNGKGTKSVEIYTRDGKLKSKREVLLRPDEMACIQRNKFVPGLFKDCIKPLRKKRATRRRRSN